MRRSLPIAALLLVALVAPAADAAGQLPTCKTLARAPLAAPGAPHLEQTQEVWDRVYGVVAELTGRSATLKVLAKGDGFSPNAQICKEATGPSVYVTHALLEQIFETRRYPIDFLAYIFGHELGHRVADFDASGRIIRPVKPDREPRADARGAFFAAAAGYSTRTIACDDCMDDFLAAEGVKAEQRAVRKEALRKVLREFDAYEGLYEAALALTLIDFDEAAKALVTWADAFMKERSVPVPELQVLHALILMSAAADSAPWLNTVTFPASAHHHLRCAPVFPAHSSLWEEARPDAASRSSGDTQRAREDLEKASKLLRSAGLAGASELAVTTGQACVAFYLGDAKAARRQLKRARRAAKQSPEPVQQVLASNEALVAWLEHLTQHPVPDAADAAATRAWSRALGKAKKGLAPSPQLAALLDALGSGHPGALGESTPAPASTGCKASSASLAPVAPVHPKRPPAGGCPCGWSEISHLPAASSAHRGVTTCVPQGWAFGQRYVDVDLPDLQLSLLVADRLDPSAQALATWERSCGDLQHRGAAEDGQTAYAACNDDERGRGSVLFTHPADSCRVGRVVSVELDPGDPSSSP